MTERSQYSSSGLSTAVATRRLAELGPNALPEAAAVPIWRRVLAQFRNPLIYILLFALAIDLTVWFGEGGHGWPLDAIAIGGILLLNSGLGVWQERKAEAALAKLSAMAAPQVWTLRDGRFVRLPSRELVPGDVVRLEAGDRVPADGRVIDAVSLSVDESVVTGESLPIEKPARAELFAGTLVARGSAHLEVVRTGPASTMGKLAALLGTVEAEVTPLERRLTVFGRQAARWVIALAVIIAVAGIGLEGPGQFGPVFLFAVALAVAAVPEGLPAILTVTLTLGVERMARRRALVRKLAAVEALGSVTVIATDKTGTLTENRLEVRALESDDEDRAIRAMVLASDADIESGIGDPLEVALLRYARRHDVDPARVRSEALVASARPFDAAWKYMRVTVREAAGTTAYFKGAPEVLMAFCRLSDERRLALEAAMAARAAEGYRLLALAAGPAGRENDLEWLGFVSLWDPPRPEVPAAIAAARAAGIRVIMVTGDHPATALTVARGLGLSPDRVLSGAEMDTLDREALQAVLAGAPLFARVAPEHKLRIVEALQAGGDIVAMTGDGVNDAPALKRADVGVAMGERGSEVSREVADLVLLDDNFATIVAAIEEGRGIYANVQKFIRFLLSTNLSEVLVVTIGAFAAILIGLRDPLGGLLLPLTAAQLLWINLVTDGAPALALGLDRNPGVMAGPPRDPKEPLLDRSSARFILLSGGIKALIAFAILYFFPALLGQSLEATRSAVFLFLAVGQLLFAYPARHTDVRPLSNPVLHLAVAGTFVLQSLLLIVPEFQRAFGMVPLPPAVLGVVLAAALSAWGVAEMVNRVLWPPKR